MNETRSSVETVSSFYQQYLHLSKLDDFVTATYLVAAFLGIPLNLYIAATIIRKERLHLPRNLMWLGVGFANTSHLLFYVALIISDNMTPTTPGYSVLINIIAASAGVPEISAFLFLFLSLLERHACLAHGFWYKAIVTNGFVIKVQVGCFGLLCLATKVLYSIFHYQCLI